MAKCDAQFREVRFVLEPELTQAYVLVEAVGDCPLGVQGWHHRTFPASVSALDILERMKLGGDNDPVLWAQDAP